ncbi:FadR/GntR family transcriptional regulator [Domibacillus mangrovi]|nr:GntR family transcriptional regulator [Domibacillus mangrovi]
MMESKRPPSKFVAAISHIREMIKADRIGSGDKLPSERELSERLSIGRSSVREALRALELLGMIETRRGEGTYLRDFKDHQLVPLIGTFIFNDDQKKEHVHDIKTILEMGCLALLAVQPDFNQHSINYTETAFHELMDASGNSLLKKMWIIISDYAGDSGGQADERLTELLSGIRHINHS